MGYLDSEGLGYFWEKVKGYVDENGGTGGQTTLPVKAPLGCIVWWSGTADNIPTGWHICDGTNGTLDLRNKFILAAGTNHAVGETGGSETVKLSLGQMPEHDHGINVASSFQIGSGSNAIIKSSVGVQTNPTIEQGPSRASGSSQPHPNMPPYYTLCAIQKIAPDETDGVQYEAGDGVTFEETESGTKINVDCPIVPITKYEYMSLPDNQKYFANVVYLFLEE